ncbi:preprotein translocase subunit SecE [Candidatus Mycoplasma haematohominis]|uniref:Preprotein translocase subunit SecE n=1 Tax=Candidatus Mycoplasma haematohominis TaxID=1494318 RepID=A0A478FSZ3_9MOLU|nr:preprotein translocase subunit SecE [Candidatus Mycoplasma haemohominis]GCE63205.1 hypothetical protein MHSWG343_01840 [Candidatus Mycoplasma haemohominis]
MATDRFRVKRDLENQGLSEVDYNPDDYSWFKVHYKSVKRSSRVLLAGVIKNFRRVTWHSKKGLIIEYIQVVGVLVFLTLFCFLIFTLVTGI